MTDKGHWNFLGTGEASAISISVMLATVNLMSRVKESRFGNYHCGDERNRHRQHYVKDKNSVITNLGTNLGYDGQAK